MKLTRCLAAALSALVLAAFVPSTAAAAGGGPAVSVTQNICEHLPWWPGCPA